MNLVGSDIGTMVAHAYATAYPAEIRRLVLSEAMLPGFGLEQIMNVAGGSWHFGFHMQVDIAEMLTAGKETAYLGGMWDVMSDGGMTEDDRKKLLRTYAGPGGTRGGFMHDVPCSRTEKPTAPQQRCRFRCPVSSSMTSTDSRGRPSSPASSRSPPTSRQTFVPDSAHTIGADSPDWLVERLNQFFTTNPATAAWPLPLATDVTNAGGARQPRGNA